jgi:hypothetical protein
MKRLSLPIGVILSVGMHLAFGWMYSVRGPVAAGYLAGRRSIRMGMLAQVLAWGLLVGWNIAVAPQESLNFMETLAGLLGGMPAFVTPLLVLVVAALCGAAAGWLGGSLRKKESSN